MNLTNLAIILTGILFSIMITFWIPKAAFKAPKSKVATLLIGYFLLYFIFVIDNPLQSWLLAKTNKLVLFIPTLYLLAAYLWLQKLTSWTLILKVIFSFLTPVFLLQIYPNQSFLTIIDLFIFLLIVVVIQSKILSLPLVFDKVIEFEGTYLAYVLLVFMIYNGVHKKGSSLQPFLNYRYLIIAVLASLLLFAIAIIIGHATKLLEIKKTDFNLQKTLLIIIFMFFHVTLIEEFFFRGLIFGFITQFISSNLLIALVLSAIIFGLTHISNSGAPMLLFSTIAGLFYGIVFLLTGSLFYSAITHTITNVGWKLFLNIKEKGAN
ncbi:MAG: CPBP family intramembrane metalloprotease [Firmicutes bacterium]|nr:CPBP family intramembrane metalloprotease [Bacillota bacterium]